jgi:uncharacterized protein
LFLQLVGFARCHVPVDYLIWSFTILLLIIGLLGSVVPMLPGTTFIMLGVVLQKLMLSATMSWYVVGWIALIWVVSVLADIAGVIIGARLFGGSKWGMTGASGGAIVGMFFSLPALLLGTFLGAVAAEKFGAKKSDHESLRSGVGATAGFLLSTFARFGCALAMIALFLIAVLSWANLPMPVS